MITVCNTVIKILYFKQVKHLKSLFMSDLTKRAAKQSYTHTRTHAQQERVHIQFLKNSLHCQDITVLIIPITNRSANYSPVLQLDHLSESIVHSSQWNASKYTECFHQIDKLHNLKQNWLTRFPKASVESKFSARCSECLIMQLPPPLFGSGISTSVLA